MNNLIRFALLVCLMFSVSNSQAQIKFGPKGGLNLSKLTFKNSGIPADPKIIAGFHLGMISEIPLKGNFVLQPAFFFSTKGAKYSFFGEEVTITPGVLEIPVSAAYKFDLGSMKLFVNAGPYFAYGVSGKIKAAGESMNIIYGSEDDSDMKPFDLGLNFGVGLEIKNIIISFSYELGLTNLVPGTTSSDEAEAKNKVIGISVGYFFGKK